MIIATAGHIDHGKTELVKVLTGVDTDRLPEEKKRGLSIDLGFAYQSLDDGPVLGFVDVPGHERFVRNMLAGVTGIDFALLVVAADDGPMPQTEEHLAILDLLDITLGAVALTKIDRVDDDRVAEVTELIEIMVESTALAGCPIFPMSAIKGIGVDPLRQHIEDAARAMGARTVAGNFRLAVDRCFNLPGAGLVVTGTVFSGATSVGDRLLLSPAGTEARVRGIHAQNRESTDGQAGQRCALNIAGPRKAGVHRGDWLVSEAAHAPSRRLDARIRVLASEAKALRHRTHIHLHVGATEAIARVATLEERSIAPGERGLIQLVLDTEISALAGDRLILRDRSATRTIGGGRIIDPFAPARGRGKPERLAILGALEIADHRESLSALLDLSPLGVDLARWARSRNLSLAESDGIWRDSDMMQVGPPGSSYGLGRQAWQDLRGTLISALDKWHADAPEDSGPGSDRLRKTMPAPVPATVFDVALLDLIDGGDVVRNGAHLHRPGHRTGKADADAALRALVEPLLDAGGTRPPRVVELAEALGMEVKAVEGFLRRSVRQGRLHAVAPNRFYPPEALLDLGRTVEELAAAAEEGFSVKAFRDSTGIGRNLAIEVLEYFDKIGMTRRSGDGRQVLKPAAKIIDTNLA